MQPVRGLGDEVAVGHVDAGPEGLEPGGVQVETARADGVAPGHRDVGLADPGHERPEHRDGRPERPDQVVVGTVAERLGHVEHDRPASGS